MFNWIKKFFSTVYPSFDAESMARTQYEESRKAYLISLQAAEEAKLSAAYHEKAAEMHKARAARIEGYFAGIN